MLLSTRKAILGAGEYRSSDVPQSEANALIAFYDATGGPAWTTKQGWGWDPVVNNWYGVTVAGGAVTQVLLEANNLVGAIGSILEPLTSLVFLNIGNNSISTLDVSSMTWMTLIYCYVTSISVLDVSSLTLLRRLYCHGNGMSAAQVDTIVKTIYDNWAAYTYATPELNISGTNAAPGGTYQDGDPPTTGLEYVYEIANDPESTGNETWAVTYTGGTAP